MSEVSNIIEGKNWRVIVGDVLDGLRTLEDGSVQCCVSSPPYFQLRDYQITGQIGLESTPDEFIAKLVAVFAEVHRVLRDDGAIFVNMGDSYNNADKWGGGGENTGKNTLADDGSVPSWETTRRRKSNPPGLKPKDLMGIPWRLALALQAWGWYWRDIIVWNKPAPMPESVRDRCTKSWEPIFMFTKSSRYFCDMEAVREDRLTAGPMKWNQGWATEGDHTSASWHSIDRNGESKYATGKETEFVNGDGRNLRNVWTLSPSNFPDAHFATFPPSLPERCIKMGTSQRGRCPQCGAPWRRVTEKTKRTRERPNALTKRTGQNGTGNHCANTVAGVAVETTGWQPSCDCGITETLPCVVLDPFSGSGTTGMVATELGREYCGIELNPAYAEMSRKRIESWKYRDAAKQPEPLPGQRELFG